MSVYSTGVRHNDPADGDVKAWWRLLMAAAADYTQHDEYTESYTHYRRLRETRSSVKVTSFWLINILSASALSQVFTANSLEGM